MATLPAYSEDENDFYDRARGNYPERAPRSEPASSDLASEVRVRGGPHEGATLRPYHDREVADIVRQGRDRPRPLTHDETDLVGVNRRDARGDLSSLEGWYRSELRESTKGRRLKRARGGPEDESLRGITLGDDVWRPYEW